MACGTNRSTLRRPPGRGGGRPWEQKSWPQPPQRTAGRRVVSYRSPHSLLRPARPGELNSWPPAMQHRGRPACSFVPHPSYAMSWRHDRDGPFARQLAGQRRPRDQGPPARSEHGANPRNEPRRCDQRCARRRAEDMGRHRHDPSERKDRRPPSRGAGERHLRRDAAGRGCAGATIWNTSPRPSRAISFSFRPSCRIRRSTPAPMSHWNACSCAVTTKPSWSTWISNQWKNPRRSSGLIPYTNIPHRATPPRRYPHRYLRLDLFALAWRVLSTRSAARKGA